MPSTARAPLPSVAIATGPITEEEAIKNAQAYLDRTNKVGDARPTQGRGGWTTMQLKVTERNVVKAVFKDGAPPLLNACSHKDKFALVASALARNARIGSELQNKNMMTSITLGENDRGALMPSSGDVAKHNTVMEGVIKKLGEIVEELNQYHSTAPAMFTDKFGANDETPRLVADVIKRIGAGGRHGILPADVPKQNSSVLEAIREHDVVATKWVEDELGDAPKQCNNVKELVAWHKEHIAKTKATEAKAAKAKANAERVNDGRYAKEWKRTVEQCPDDEALMGVENTEGLTYDEKFVRVFKNTVSGVLTLLRRRQINAAEVMKIQAMQKTVAQVQDKTALDAKTMHGVVGFVLKYHDIKRATAKGKVMQTVPLANDKGPDGTTAASYVTNFVAAPQVPPSPSDKMEVDAVQNAPPASPKKGRGQPQLRNRGRRNDKGKGSAKVIK